MVSGIRLHRTLRGLESRVWIQMASGIRLPRTFRGLESLGLSACGGSTKIFSRTASLRIISSADKIQVNKYTKSTHFKPRLVPTIVVHDSTTW